jgi:succinate dehydrogenase / fumarate reductase membrane anchor subunit
MQRVTAIGLLLLGVWFLWSFASLDSFSHADLTGWVAQWTNAVMLLLLSVALSWHSSLGVQVVIEDYVHGPALKVFTLIFSRFAHILLAATGIFAVLNIALDGTV